MLIRRTLVPCLLFVLASGACTVNEAEQTTPDSGMDSVDVAREVERQVATADSVERQMRLRTLRATLDDLAERDSGELRVEVDIKARRVRVLDARSDTLAQHDIAVGSQEWPTRTGEWTISQVVLNPEWIPPTSEEWAEEADSSPPGDPDNPLGHAQLVYDLPRSIHGTNNPSSIGKAVSHGSIRASNENVLSLAELLMQRTGVERASEIVEEAQRNRSVKRIVDLPQLVPIRVY